MLTKYFLAVQLLSLMRIVIVKYKLKITKHTWVVTQKFGTLPLLFETVVTVTLNWGKVTRYFSLLLLVCAPMFTTRLLNKNVKILRKKYLKEQTR